LFSRIRARKPTHLFTDEWRSPILAEEFAQRVLDVAVSDQQGLFHIAGKKAYNRFELGKQLALQHGLSTDFIFPRKRCEDRWAHIRPRDITLESGRPLTF